ncbi:hypothetical protein [Trichlorobacter lovleyi]|uniref:Lipoprotein, putative n=1 Tax=Trichlorobacter lovleyi (strain ATCC BAA-1151 / DSM 17278 / SZ) TaxID=398767 RepID=B3E951_TRIL1|nr:hypothetical protein [Trichlorobacter lovleyi]ACD96764.1 lipoprotein, putative [Trichlorobacter lovleyi SZ]
MKATIVTLMIAALALAGCQDKPKTEAPTNQQAAGALPAGHPPVGGMPPAQDGKAAMPGGAEKGDPHAGLKPTAIPQGVPTKSGKVLEVLDGGQYIYMQVQHDDGKKIWVAALPMKVAKGDKVKYADAPALPNFPSKTLKRTFDALVLTQAVEVVK